MTRARSWAKRSAVARPLPMPSPGLWPAPMMIAVLPSRRMAVPLGVCGAGPSKITRDRDSSANGAASRRLTTHRALALHGHGISERRDDDDESTDLAPRDAGDRRGPGGRHRADAHRR